MMRPDSPNPLLLLVFTNCGKSLCSVQGFGNHVQNCHSADGLYSVVPTELILGSNDDSSDGHNINTNDGSARVRFGIWIILLTRSYYYPCTHRLPPHRHGKHVKLKNICIHRCKTLLCCHLLILGSNDDGSEGQNILSCFCRSQ